MTPALLALLQASEKLTVRLRILQRMQIQARERGELTVELDIRELFEAGDLEAIKDWEAAKAQAMGQVPLLMEVSA